MAKVRGPSAVSDDAKWQAEDDLRSLERAAEVKADAKRLRRARRFHTKRSQSLKSMLVRR